MSNPENVSPASVPAATAPARMFRIFISSPGDLGEERVICGRVVDRLKAEFARAARLQAILWEQEPLTADLHFQEQIPLPSQTDIVVMLLWSRLGYHLHHRYKAAGETRWRQIPSCRLLGGMARGGGGSHSARIKER